MLLPKDIHPKDSLYYIGGFILDALKNYEDVDFMDLFMSTKEKIDVSISIFTLSLDWLFLAGIVQANSKGNLEYVH